MLSQQEKDKILYWFLDNGLNKIDFRGWDKDILVLDKFCYAGKEDSIFPGNLKIRINKFMDLALLTNIPDNFFPEVGWSLYLNNLHFPKLKRLPESGIISVSGGSVFRFC